VCKPVRLLSPLVSLLTTDFPCFSFHRSKQQPERAQVPCFAALFFLFLFLPDSPCCDADDEKGNINTLICEDWYVWAAKEGTYYSSYSLSYIIDKRLAFFVFVFFFFSSLFYRHTTTTIFVCFVFTNNLWCDLPTLRTRAYRHQVFQLVLVIVVSKGGGRTSCEGTREGPHELCFCLSSEEAQGLHSSHQSQRKHNFSTFVWTDREVREKRKRNRGRCNASPPFRSVSRKVLFRFVFLSQQRGNIPHN